jgi:hypothetical protein
MYSRLWTHKNVRKSHIPSVLVVAGVTAHWKPPEVKICRLKNQSAVRYSSVFHFYATLPRMHGPALIWYQVVQVRRPHEKRLLAATEAVVKELKVGRLIVDINGDGAVVPSLCGLLWPMCHPQILRSRQLSRHHGGHTWKSQDDCEGLGMLPLKAMECGVSAWAPAREYHVSSPGHQPLPGIEHERGEIDLCTPARPTRETLHRVRAAQDTYSPRAIIPDGLVRVLLDHLRFPHDRPHLVRGHAYAQIHQCLAILLAQGIVLMITPWELPLKLPCPARTSHQYHGQTAHPEQHVHTTSPFPSTVSLYEWGPSALTMPQRPQAPRQTFSLMDPLIGPPGCAYAQP